MKKIKQKITHTLKSFIGVSTIAIGLFANADDTEVFYSVNVSNNLLFVLDVSGSMRKKISITETTTSGGTTTTSGGGVSGDFEFSVYDPKDDATQLWSSSPTATAGDQWYKDGGGHDGDDLDLEKDRAVGLRFKLSDDIPIGSTITEAYIQFTAIRDRDEATTIDISIEDEEDTDHYKSSKPKILNRGYFGSIPWSPAAWDEDDRGAAQRTPELKSLVQHVVDQWELEEDEYIGFKLNTTVGERDAFARDEDKDEAPKLVIKYLKSNGSTKTRTGKIKDKDDDAEQEYTYVSAQKNDETELVFDDTQVVATRFRLKDDSPDSLIPQGANIVEAYIKFTSAGNYSAATTIEVSIEDTHYAEEYSSGNTKILDRSYHGIESWAPPAWTTNSQSLSEQTIDVKDLVQHVVDKSDWDNALAFLFNTTSGNRTAYARDEGSSEAPVLHVEYQDIGGGTGTTTTTTGTTTTTTRIDTRLKFMQEALREVFETAPNLNVGLMKYSGINRDQKQGKGDDNKRHHYTGGVIFPVSPIYEKASDHIGVSDSNDNLPDPGATITVRDYIPDVADNWEPTGGTPIVDALYEAALYFRGESMHYGKNKNNNGLLQKVSPGSHRSTYVGGTPITNPVGSVGRSNIADANYISPIKDQCQSNYIVLMSDGKPTYYYSDGSSGGNNKGPFARAMAGTNASTLSNQTEFSSCLTGNGEAGNTATKLVAGTCGREITQYLANNDQSSTVDDVNTVKTFTIGFGHDLEAGAREYLQSLETVDGVGYYDADDKNKLKEAFNKIFEAVAEPSGTLASPGYSVNVKSGLEHENDIYIPVFERKNSALWSGNLKKFRIKDVGGKRNIQSRGGTNAVDELGGFEDSALDYWSKSTTAAPDGPEVQKGGVAELLDAENRNLYTDVNCSGSGECNLTLGETHKLVTDNANITNDVLDINNLGLTAAEKATRRIKLINFIRGWENGNYDSSQPVGSRGIERHHMGDMLHAEPYVVTYDKGAEDGSGKKQYIFAATNEGYLHAFNTSDDPSDPEAGKEMFAFMPAELLKNINPQFENAGSSQLHKYGIDGAINYWHDTANNKRYLYFGLRRGGRSYYALDVTDITKPKLAWKVSASDGGRLTEMGQSWSTPYLARVGLSGETSKEVVIISAGYDEVDDRDKHPTELNVLDDPTTSVTGITTMGRNIYIFDAKDGTLLWDLRGSTGDTQLANSTPGGIRVLDVNRNGLVDRMYFADTGGYVWRLDLSESLTFSNDDKSKLTKLADLSTSGTGSRKFYNEPDVSVLSPNGKTIFAVSIGSGFRAHPKDKTINDNFYILKDESPYSPLADDYVPILHNSNDLASVSIDTTSGALTHSGFATADRGWYLDLPEDGEKSLGTAVTFDGVVTFTTLVPEVLTSGDNIDVCAAPVTQGRLYALNILSGEAALNLDYSQETNVTDRITDKDAFSLVAKGEIPGKPQLIFNELTKTDELNGSGEIVKSTCEHPVDLRIGKKLSQATGYDACRLESIYWNNPKND